MGRVWNLLEKIMYFFAHKVFRLTVSETQWEKWCQFVQLGLVGVSNNLINYGIYAVLILLSVNYLAAYVAGYLVSILNAYYWNNRYVFKEQEEEHRVWWKTLAKTFFAYAGIGLILSNILLVICVRVLSIHEMLAPILILFVTTPVNFLVNKLWAYRGKNDG